MTAENGSYIWVAGISSASQITGAVTEYIWFRWPGDFIAPQDTYGIIYQYTDRWLETKYVGVITTIQIKPFAELEIISSIKCNIQ